MGDSSLGTSQSSTKNQLPSQNSRPRRRVIVVAVVAAVVLAAVVATLSISSIRWRVQIVALHVISGIPDIEWKDVLMFVAPGSSGYNNVARLIETRNPYAVIGNPRASAADAKAGGELFASKCVACHGLSGRGGAAAPALAQREFTHGDSDWAIYRTIRLGVPGSAMPAHDLPTPQAWQLVAYIRSLDFDQRERLSVATAAIDVPYERLQAAHSPAEDWLTYSGSYSSQRHSVLTQLDGSNVHQIALRWAYQFSREPPKIEASPLVSDGIMFMTLPNGRVLALDATTGKQFWAFERALPAGAAAGEFGASLNRGVALLDDKVFFGTGDAHLIAVASSSGNVLWDTPLASPSTYYISAAPLAYRDLVVTGVGTKGGGRGFIVALDAATGKERWRFVTVPGPGEFGNDTWAGESWREGGAPTWMTGSYDPERDLLIWGAGNPKPDYDAAVRLGDNLYSNSALALRGVTGELVWHFQFTPADDKDWDSNQVPILADFNSDKGPLSRVLWANRNGFYYVLDRTSGKYLNSMPFVQQTWTAGIDPNGRPLSGLSKVRRPEGVIIYPGNVGGTNWWPASYDSQRKLVFVPVVEAGMLFFPSEKSWPRSTGKPLYTSVRAMDAESGKRVWEYRRPPRADHAEIGGLLSTAGGLVFGSDETTFFALDSTTGELLWSVETGGAIGAAPITYAVNGEQYVAIAAGKSLLVFVLPKQRLGSQPLTDGPASDQARAALR